MKPKLYIVTGSSFKFADLSLELSEFFDCEQKIWDEHEIQGKAEEIIRHKVEKAYEVFQHPVLVDDVSFCFDELNGFPGPYMKDFLNCMDPYEMGSKFKGTKATTICYLGLCLGEGKTIIAKGELGGAVVSPKTRDHQGRYFETCFQAEGTDKPMIEFSPEEKNKFSHRGIAMRNLLAMLKDR